MSDAQSESQVIIKTFLAGDKPGFPLVTEWVDHVLRFSGWDPIDREDIRQITLQAIIENFQNGSYRGGSLQYYVQRICKNKCNMEWRRVYKRRDRFTRLEEGVEVPSEDKDALESIITDEEYRLVVKVLKRLSRDCQKVIIWARKRGLSRLQIAERLGITEGAARKRLFDCSRRLVEGMAALDGV